MEPSLFVLVAALCLFGYLIFNNFTVNARLERLTDMVREVRPEAELAAQELSPFRWETVLASAEGGLPFLGERLLATRPGLYAVGARDPALVSTLAANIISQVLGAEDVAVVYASEKGTMEQLGLRLLSLAAGADWEAMPTEEQDRVLHRLQRELARYESNLFLLTGARQTPERLAVGIERLAEQCRRPLAAIVVDDPSWAADESEEFLDRLRVLAQRRGVPLFLVVGSQESGAFTRWQTVGADRFQAILDFSRPAAGERKLAVQYLKFPQTPPTVSYELDLASGQIVEAS